MQIAIRRSVAVWAEIRGPLRNRLLRLLVDTGAGHVTIYREAAVDMGFDLDHPEEIVKLVSANGVVDAPTFTSPSVLIEDVEVSDVCICVHDLPDQARVEIDGLLGMSFLEHTIFTFDFKTKMFTMVDP